MTKKSKLVDVRIRGLTRKLRADFLICCASEYMTMNEKLKRMIKCYVKRQKSRRAETQELEND